MRDCLVADVQVDAHAENRREIGYDMESPALFLPQDCGDALMYPLHIEYAVRCSQNKSLTVGGYDSLIRTR